MKATTPTPLGPEAMESKTARLTVLIDPAKKQAFEALCAVQDVTPSQVVRRLIREYLAMHGVTFVPSGAARDETPEKAPVRGVSTRRSR